MIRLGICDDDAVQVETLYNYATEFFQKENIECEIKKVFNGADFLEDAAKYDIVFLDVVLNSAKNGIDVGLELRGKNAVVKIIYVTLYDNYVLPALDTYCFNYLQKPIKREKIEELLHKAIAIIKKESEKIVLISAGREYFLDIKEIIYIKSDSHSAIIYTKTKEMRCNHTLAEIEEKLKTADFATVHRSALVNMQHIVKKSKTSVYMSNNEEFQISRRKAEEFRKKFENYISRGRNHA